MLNAKARRPLSYSWRIVPILAIIAIITYIGIYLAFCAEIKAVMPYVDDLIESGKSFFIPSIPDVNVFWYMPPEFQLRLPLGQLVDSSIITFIVSSLLYFGYPYYKALKGTTSLQFVYLDKSGASSTGNFESPLSRTFMVSGDQLALVDFENHIDQERSRERIARRLNDTLSRVEDQEGTRVLKLKRGHIKRNMSHSGTHFDDFTSRFQISNFASRAFKIMLNRFLFWLHVSFLEMITLRVPGNSISWKKKLERGK